MTMKTLLLGAAITGALIVPALAMAADTAPVAAKTEVAKEAAPAVIAAAPALAGTEGKAEKAFASFDADKNGSISEDEFLNHKKEMKSEKLTPEQITEKKKARFKEVDANGDGKIDDAEFKAFGEKMKAKRAEMMEKKADAAKEEAKDTPKSEEDHKDAPKAEEAHKEVPAH